MQKPSFAELRDYAEQCLRMAGDAGSEKGRRFLIEMASLWHALAQEREDEERADSAKGAADRPLSQEGGG